jgi:hypothetical protein
MESYLHSIGCFDQDIDLYVMYLEDAGIYNSEDLMIKEPTMEELEEWGVINEHDRECIYYACHPEEENPNGPLVYRAQPTSNYNGDFDESFLRNYISEMEKQKESDAFLAELGLDNEPEVAQFVDPNFDKPKYAKAQSMLEFNNTMEFIKLIEEMDVNMVDPSDSNSYVIILFVCYYIIRMFLYYSYVIIIRMLLLFV